MTDAAADRPIPNRILPLVRRHAEDAAFYWHQIDRSTESLHLRPPRLRHFDALLAAHLEGLEIAGHDGLSCARKALERWLKPGEAFVCAWLALQLKDQPTLDALGRACVRTPDALLRGVICALSRLPFDTAGPCLAAWSSRQASPTPTVAALRAVALIGRSALEALGAPVATFLEHPDAHVRAAACRAANDPACATALLARLRDDDATVRAEAAIALGFTAGGDEAPAVLWRCILEQANRTEAATGWGRFQARRRLVRWVRHLATIVPLGHPDLPRLLACLPRRVGLCFALQHGDPAHLHWVLDAMDEPDVARYAGWVWQALTGVDLREAGLTQAEEPDPERGLTDARLDADQGLPLPAPAAVRAAHAGLGLSAPSLLLGQARTPGLLLDVLQQGPQGLRALAARSLRQAVPGRVVQVRAPFQRQTQQLAELARELAL